MRLTLGQITKWSILIYDIAAVVVAWLLAYCVRYGVNELVAPSFHNWVEKLPVFIIFHGLAFAFLRTNQGIWRHTSVIDLAMLTIAIVAGYTLTIIWLGVTGTLGGHGRIIYFLYPVFLVTFIFAGRIIVRSLYEFRSSLFRKNEKKVLIIGAGQAGIQLVRDIRSSKNMGYSVVGFIDDAPSLKKKSIQGARVLGGIGNLKKIAQRTDPSLLVVAIPSLKNPRLKQIIDVCESTGITTRILPSTSDLISGRLLINQLKEVSLEDLLGRQPISLDRVMIGKFITKATVLVTGGGGSIGLELCRQISQFKPMKLIVTDVSEFNLYKAEQEFTTDYPEIKAEFRLVDVTDTVAVESVLASVKPNIIFHAAAYKHVPLLEYQLREAVRNNVLGTQIVADAAAKFGVPRFILVSTDKAVNPTNIMGTTKRLAEIYCQNLSIHTTTKFITVRFGNVLGSAGSVIPLFKEQLMKGGPLTVTHPEISRFFMTIPEACQLVLQAGAMGDGGEIFVLEMGEPVRIIDLAEKLIRLSGKVPYEDIDITFTGLRPGEKLYEELFHEGEGLTPTTQEKICMAQSREVDFKDLNKHIKTMRQAVVDFDEVVLLNSLITLVPEANITPKIKNAS